MNRFGVVLVVLAVVFAACGGSAQEDTADVVTSMTTVPDQVTPLEDLLNKKYDSVKETPCVSWSPVCIRQSNHADADTEKAVLDDLEHLLEEAFGQPRAVPLSDGIVTIWLDTEDALQIVSTGAPVYVGLLEALEQRIQDESDTIWNDHPVVAERDIPLVFGTFAERGPQEESIQTEWLSLIHPDPDFFELFKDMTPGYPDVSAWLEAGDVVVKVILHTNPEYTISNDGILTSYAILMSTGTLKFEKFLFSVAEEVVNDYYASLGS